MLRKTLLAIVVPLMLVAAPAQPDPAQLSDDEYAVYAAMLDTFHSARKSSHPVVADRTATFQCHSKCNGMEIGGCNGLRSEDETPAERLAIVKRDLPQLNRDSSEDFAKKNQACSNVAKKIPTRMKYLLSLHEGDYLPDGWDSPDYFFFSRVGFDAGHTQALVVVGFFSGTDARDSKGKYFLLSKQSGKWMVQGSSFVWQLVSEGLIRHGFELPRSASGKDCIHLRKYF
jgi:hypothetical protein